MSTASLQCWASERLLSELRYRQLENSKRLFDELRELNNSGKIA